MMPSVPTLFWRSTWSNGAIAIQSLPHRAFEPHSEAYGLRLL
jgi:hypothetical protein